MQPVGHNDQHLFHELDGRAPCCLVLKARHGKFRRAINGYEQIEPTVGKTARGTVFPNGGEGARTVRVVEVPDPEVPEIRAQTGLSQAEFALSIGVKKATQLNWEQGRRKPDGPARVLLALIAKDPGIVQRVLGGKWGGTGNTHHVLRELLHALQ